MRLAVLGCSGGIGAGLRTTSLLVDADILIDAGTGVGDLTLDAMRRIDHVFLTHSHLDHVTSLPFLLDTVGSVRERAVTVYALQETIEILRTHLFNWKLWPDFTQIPNAENPWLRFQSITLGETVALGKRKITALPARHTVPAVGYLLDSGEASLAFSGDTIDCPEFWQALNRVENLRHLIIETSFANEDKGIAHASRHYHPTLLAEQLPRLLKQAEIYITHLGPEDQPRIMSEILTEVHGSAPRMLAHGQQFEF